MIPAFNGDPWPGEAARYTLACWCLQRVRMRARGPRPRRLQPLMSPIEDRERLQRAMRLLEWLGACARFAPIGVACVVLFFGCSSNTGPLASADAADLGSEDVAHVLRPRDAGELEDAGAHQVDAGELEDAGAHQVDAGELEDAGAHQVDAGELEDAGAHQVDAGELEDAGVDAGAGVDCAATTCPGGLVCLACAGCVPIGFACEAQP